MFDRYIPQSGWVSTEAEERRGPLGGMMDNLLGFLGMGEPRREVSPFQGIPFLEKLDTGDILLLLILYYLYRETGDEEWLIILGLTLFLS